MGGQWWKYTGKSPGHFLKRTELRHNTPRSSDSPLQSVALVTPVHWCSSSSDAFTMKDALPLWVLTSLGVKWRPSLNLHFFSCRGGWHLATYYVRLCNCLLASWTQWFSRNDHHLCACCLQVCKAFSHMPFTKEFLISSLQKFCEISTFLLFCKGGNWKIREFKWLFQRQNSSLPEEPWF